MSRKLLKEMTYVKMASLPLYICSLLLCSIFGAGQALGSQVTLTATEDAYVSELTHTGNYGNTSNLFIGWVNDTSYAYETYLKFGLSSIPSGSIINSATLRLYCTDVGWDRWVYGNVHYVMGSWAESTITWDNKPSYGSANESEEYNTTGWWEWDVQDFVQDWVDGTRPNHGFAIEADDDGDFMTEFCSSEHSTSSQRPQLVIEYVEAGTGWLDVASTPSGADIWLNGADSGYDAPHIFTLDTGSYTVQLKKSGYIPSNVETVSINKDATTYVDETLIQGVVLEPTADSFVGKGGSGYGNPNANHGSESELSAGYETGVGITTRSYLKFDVSTSIIPAGSTVNSATLTLFCTGWTSGSNVNMAVAHAAGSWSEDGITWNNQPGIGSGIGTMTVSGIGRTTGTDLLSAVEAWRGGTANDGIVVSHSQRILWFGSREDSENWRPQLVVAYDLPTISGVSIDIDPETAEGDVEQGGTVVGDGTIMGTGTGEVEYYWMVRKPGGIFEPASSLLSTQMTNGSATIPSFDGFPTSDIGEHKTWIRIQSPGGPDDSLSNEEFYTVVPAEPSVELTLYRISAPDGTQNTSAPGTSKTIFNPGETVRVTLGADNTGANADVRTVLNIREPDDSTILYDSHNANTTDSATIEDNSFDTPLISGEGYDYYSFDKVIPTNANAGQYDVGGAIRNLTLWDEVYDTTASGRNDEDWSNSWLENQFLVEIPEVHVELEVGSAVFRDGAYWGLDWHTAIFWFYDGYFDEYRVIQHGTDHLIGDVIWSQFLDGDNYRGARQHVDAAPPSAMEQQEIIYWAKYQFNAEYTGSVGWGTVWPYNHPNTSYQSGDGRFRCDQFVEHVYACVFDTELRPGYAFDTPRNVYNGENAVPVVVASPSVVSVQHTNDLNTDITIEFSELMSAGTVEPDFGNAISIFGDVHGSYEYNVTFESDPLFAREDLFEHFSTRHDCKRVIVDTVEDFLPGETVTLTVSTTARDLGGNPMNSAYMYSFAVYRRADFDQDGDVDCVDLATLIAAWLTEPGDVDWNPEYDISMPADNIINFQDFAELAKCWQEGTN